MSRADWSGVSALWRVMIEGWLAALVAANRTPTTVHSHGGRLRQLARAFPNVSPWSITPTELAGWIEGQTWSAASRRRFTYAARSFYQWGQDQGHLTRSPIPTPNPATWRAPGPAAATVPNQWAAPLQDFRTWLVALGRSPGTIRQYRHHMTNLGRVHPDPWAVTADDLVRWIASAVAAESKKDKRTAARVFYQWAVTMGRIRVSPAAGIPPVKVPYGLPRPIRDDVLRQAFEGADDRQSLILLLAGLAGLRRAEIAALHFDHVHDGKLLVVNGKGGRDRWVPLHPDLERALNTERDRRHQGQAGTGWAGYYLTPNGWVFPSSTRNQPISPDQLHRIIRPVLPPGETLHKLRHRFATKAYDVHRDLRAVQELLGHVRPETTARYAAVPDGAKRDAVAGVGLR